MPQFRCFPASPASDASDDGERTFSDREAPNADLAIVEHDSLNVPEARRRIMRAIKGKNTTPELTVRKLLHRLGYRFRLHRRDLPGTPDIVFPAKRKVIEVRGCFWHVHGCSRSGIPKTRPDFWAGKLAANVRRDANNRVQLDVLGWTLLEVWQCELNDVELLKTKLVSFLGPPGQAPDIDRPRCPDPRKRV